MITADSEDFDPMLELYAPDADMSDDDNAVAQDDDSGEGNGAAFVVLRRQVMISGEQLINAKQDFEPQSGQPVVSRSNFLPPPAEGAVLEKGVVSEKPRKLKVVAAKKKPKGGAA